MRKGRAAVSSGLVPAKPPIALMSLVTAFLADPLPGSAGADKAKAAPWRHNRFERAR
jgi:hypothetical protein